MQPKQIEHLAPDANERPLLVEIVCPACGQEAEWIKGELGDIFCNHCQETRCYD